MEKLGNFEIQNEWQPCMMTKHVLDIHIYSLPVPLGII